MEWVSEEWPELTLKQLLSYIASTGIVFGGVLPYIPQYKTIRETENADGFSTYVCLALLLANTLRILFWFGRQFETPLLVQSVVMNAAMIAMIELCVRVNNKNLLIASKNRFFIDLDLRYFWQWTDFISYIECLATFTVLSGIFMYIFIDVVVVVETVGFLSVFIEALLGSPQLIKNYKNKSTLGMSKLMVILWTFGDIFKTIYFLVRRAPLQFWICGLLQVTIDLLIFGQTLLYRMPYKKVSKTYIH